MGQGNNHADVAMIESVNRLAEYVSKQSWNLKKREKLTGASHSQTCLAGYSCESTYFLDV